MGEGSVRTERDVAVAGVSFVLGEGGVSEPRKCVPEWCESGTEPHDNVCDNAPMGPMTKHEFVEFLAVAADQAVEAYRMLVTMDDLPADEAQEVAVEEVRESSTCYAGIGSCGRGWCRHG